MVLGLERFVYFTVKINKPMLEEGKRNRAFFFFLFISFFLF
jgi:hypothetical protein